MEYRFSIRIKTCSFIKCFKYKCIVVAVTEFVRNNTSVVEIKYCGKIELLYLGTYVILKLSYIG